jgi:allantoinase
LSAASALSRVALAKKLGANITVETTPHYLFFTAEEIADNQTTFKCCPPIRPKENREKLWEGLASDVIDTVGSDHSPCTYDLKKVEKGDFMEV